jgi:hypothetical protein
MKTTNTLVFLVSGLCIVACPAQAQLTLPYQGSLKLSNSDVNAVSVTLEGSIGSAIYGRSNSLGGNIGLLGGRWSGVYGESKATAIVAKNVLSGAGSYAALGRENNAVYALVENRGDVAVWAQSNGLYGQAGYFLAGDEGGVGIYAAGGSGGYAGYFDGLVKVGSIEGTLRIQSPTTGQTIIELGEGLDYAEGFAVSDMSGIAPGSVLVIDADHPGQLRLSDTPYDVKVSGIVVGARGLGSGVRLGATGSDCDVALAGRVYCNVEATEASVEPGDLLTTSSISGHAMKVVDRVRAQGAILGKAMQRLEKGTKGQILVLVTLQ